MYDEVPVKLLLFPVWKPFDSKHAEMIIFSVPALHDPLAGHQLSAHVCLISVLLDLFVPLFPLYSPGFLASGFLYFVFLVQKGIFFFLFSM